MCDGHATVNVETLVITAKFLIKVLFLAPKPPSISIWGGGGGQGGDRKRTNVFDCVQCCIESIDSILTILIVLFSYKVGIQYIYSVYLLQI